MTLTTAANNLLFWQLGQITFAVERHQLIRGGQQLYLEPRQYQLLKMLLANQLQPVTRDQLIASVWQGRVVSDGAINRAVSMLRKAFYQLDPNTDYITTLPKLGYQLAITATATSHCPVTEDAPKSLPWLIRWRAIIPILLLSVVALFWWQKPKPSQWLNMGVAMPHTSFYGTESQVSTNQDATILLYHRIASNGNSQVWQNLLSDNRHQALTPDSEDNRFAALSPDGSQFAYVRYQADSCHIMLQSLSAQPSFARTLHSCPIDNAPQLRWQPDGKALYLRQRADKTQPYQIFKLSVSSGIMQQLTLLPVDYNGLGDIALAISADTKQLAVIRYLSANRSQLLLLDSHTADIIQQQTLTVRFTQLEWLNSSQLLLSAGKTLYQFDLTQSALQAIYHSAEHITSFSLAKDSLYFSSIGVNTDIWQLNANAKPSVYVNSSHMDAMPRISHSGSQLAFLSTRQGHHQLWLKQINGHERLLAELPGTPAFVRLEWATDDSSILISKDGAAYKVDVETATVSTLIAKDKQLAVANWGQDNNSVLYSTRRNGDWQLWLYNLSSQTEQLLTSTGGYSGRIWQGQLYYTQYHQNGLWQQDLASGAVQMLIADVDKINWLNWQIDGNQLYYYQPQQGIFQYDLQTNNRSLFLAEPADFVRHFSIRQGTIYYVTQRDIQEDIYRLPLLSDKPL